MPGQLELPLEPQRPPATTVAPRPTVSERIRWLKFALQAALALLILKVTTSIIAGYVNYFPPDFSATFLQGRRDYFFGSYQWTFYPHIIAGPLTLLFGLLLMQPQLRRRFPRGHARLGQLQVALVLLILAPSGFWMALRAHAGPATQLGFALLSIATAASAAVGWLTARQRQLALHGLWMTRCYLLLCSAVVTRLLGGSFLLLGWDGDWTYLTAAWFSWLGPLSLLETTLWLRRMRQSQRGTAILAVTNAHFRNRMTET